MNQSANADNSTSISRQETPSQEVTVSNPTDDSIVIPDQFSVPIAVVEPTVNTVNPTQSMPETVQDHFESNEPMEIDSPEVSAISITAPSKTEVPIQLDDAILKELNSPGLMFMLNRLLKIDETVQGVNATLQLLQQTNNPSTTEFRPLETKGRAQEYKDISPLLAPVKGLLITPEDYRKLQVQKWVKYRASFIARLKEVGVDGVHAATVLKTNLPECVRSAIDPLEDIKDPYELARAVDEAIMGDPEVTMVTTDGLLDLLVNKLSTPSEALKTLKLWRAYESSNEDASALWCRFAMYLLPESARRKICDWDEYRKKDYQGVWNRLHNKVSAVVTNKEYLTFCHQNRSFTV
jgi:hypothetical protein